jgi:NAD+ synthase (glutamine-hydrolysing)
MDFYSGLSSMDSTALDMIEDALVSGLRDFAARNGFTQAHLGFSGGIDSALTAYLAVKALGAENITGISMPSRFSSQGSREDAALLAQNLGCRYEILPIEECFSAFLSTLKGVFENRPFDIAEENLQARIRGVLLMAYSNKFNSMLLTTGNKSEIAMGYCTLYGDTNGAIGPIGDLFKTEIFALCRRINERHLITEGREIIPRATIEKPPSAELKENQKDEDSLPPYDVLDAVLNLYLNGRKSKEEIIKKGWDRELVERITGAHTKTDFKRRQLPPVLKIIQGGDGLGLTAQPGQQR